MLGGMFERAKPRGQLSAREVREAGKVLEAGRAVAASGAAVNFPASGPGGTSWLGDEADLFVGRVTARFRASISDPWQYAFEESWGTPSTGAYAYKTSGRKGTTTQNYAVAVPGLTLTADGTEYALLRRHPRNPNLYEILGLAGASGASITPNCDSAAATHHDYSCDSGSLIASPYTDTTEVCIDAAGALTVTVTRVGP